jgi:O-antigen ligase
VSTKRIDQIGAQPDDPPWARLLFLLVQGRDGQWWRGLLLVALTGLLGVALVGALALAGWVGGALGVAAGIAALARGRRQANSGRRSGGG